MKKIYFAGKVTNSKWREVIFGERPNSIFEFSSEDLYKTINKYEGFLYLGSISIACDHSCGHQLNHAIGLTSCSGEENPFISDEHISIVSLCYELIDTCDNFIAVIDTLDSYGTFNEIGYAIAKNKSVQIFVKESLVKEVWFNFSGKCKYTVYSDLTDLKNKFFKGESKEFKICENKPIRFSETNEIIKIYSKYFKIKNWY